MKIKCEISNCFFFYFQIIPVFENEPPPVPLSDIDEVDSD